MLVIILDIPIAKLRLLITTTFYILVERKFREIFDRRRRPGFSNVSVPVLSRTDSQIPFERHSNRLFSVLPGGYRALRTSGQIDSAGAARRLELAL
jgi:hypothetical protein